jgi:hypothetical protein
MDFIEMLTTKCYLGGGERLHFYQYLGFCTNHGRFHAGQEQPRSF